MRRPALPRAYFPRMGNLLPQRCFADWTELAGARAPRIRSGDHLLFRAPPAISSVAPASCWPSLSSTAPFGVRSAGSAARGGHIVYIMAATVLVGCIGASDGLGEGGARMGGEHRFRAARTDITASYLSSPQLRSPRKLRQTIAGGQVSSEADVPCVRYANPVC